METKTEMIADLMNAIFDARETMSDATYKALTELLSKKHTDAKKVEENKKAEEMLNPWGIAHNEPSSLGISDKDFTKENCKLFKIEFFTPVFTQKQNKKGGHYMRFLKYKLKSMYVLLPYSAYEEIFMSKTINYENTKVLFGWTVNKGWDDKKYYDDEYCVSSIKEVTDPIIKEALLTHSYSHIRNHSLFNFTNSILDSDSDSDSDN